MRREFGILFLSAAFGCGGMNVSGHAEPSSVVQQLTVTTDDGKALYGEIDFPFADSAHALVLLVPGTGGYDRNMKFGRSGTADDLIFARLANALTGKGLAVVRYDERGRACTPNLEPGQDGLCADKTLISQVTPERTATDIANVAAAAMRDSKSACLIVIAHSEGMLKTALAMETGRLKPDAIIGLGALMESPASVFWWQMVLRERDSLRMMTTDKDGIVTPEQIRAGWSKTPIGVYPLTEAMVPHSALTAADIDGRPAIWLPFYQSERDIAVSHHDDELYSVGAKPVASYRWWKQFFVDWKPVAARLAGFSGRLDLIYGSIDSQTPAERQVPAAQSFLANAILTISILPNVGHTLGTNVLLGPMTNVALDQTVVTAAERAKGCKNSGEG